MTIGFTAVAVVAGTATGVLAAPASPPSAAVAVSETLAPVLHGEATASGTGSESLHFFARTVGSSTWDLLDDATVAGRDVYRALPSGELEIGEAFEYRISHCDDTGCNPSAIETGHVAPDLAAGARPGATRLPFTIGDKIAAQVDVGTGNLLVTTTQFSLRRVAGSLDLGLAWNGLTLAPGSNFDSSIAPGWRFSTGGDVRLVDAGGGSLVFYGPNGLTGTFTWDGSGYVSPPTVKGTLTKDGATGNYALQMHTSGDTHRFTSTGRLYEIEDRSGNPATFTYTPLPYGGPEVLSRVETEVGGTAGRRVDVDGYDADGRIGRLSQTVDPATSREATYTYDSNDRLVEIVDVLGRSTTFAYNTAGDLASITAPGGATTTFGYDSAHRVTSVTQPSDAPGDAVTRLVYNAGQTLVADPNTDSGQPVTVVPRTTYDLTPDGWRLVDTATDPSGATQSATYTPFLDVASASNSSGTTSFGYDTAVNGGESLTGITSPTSAGSSYSYGNAAPAQYLPSEGEDAQGNLSTYSYDSSTGTFLGGTDAAGATAEIARNGDGTVDTATDPKNNVTDYTHDGDKQLVGIAPPTGNTLGNRAYTFDDYGRIATFTSGRGIVETYSYDDADRVLEIDYSDTTPSVAYTYDTAGRVHTRTDASGTTTYTYDPLGRLASRQHSAGGGLLTYDYDLAGNLTAETDGVGTTTHAYDGRNLLEATSTPDGRTIRYAHDPDRRRTDTWFNTNTGNTTWAARTHTDYDNSGRITRVWTARDSDDTKRVSDLSYSYTSPGSSTACPTAADAGDTGLRWSQTDHVAGETTSYCYENNRLISASTPGGDSWEYIYDANGNRTQTIKNGTTVDTQSVNTGNQIDDTGWDYDGAGNLTAAPGGMALAYTGSNQVQTRSGSANGSYVFAGSNQNELISQVVPGGNTFGYTWGRADRNDLPLLEGFTSNAGTTALWHDDASSPLAIRTPNGGVAYYALDGLGSPVALVNSNGVHVASYSYDPYGEVTVTNLTNNSATTLNPYRFAGGLHDRTTDYIKYGQRFYDPATGRWTQQDSLEILADPTRANRYQYVASNPINYVDATGLMHEYGHCDPLLPVIGQPWCAMMAPPADCAEGTVLLGGLAFVPYYPLSVFFGLLGIGWSFVC